MKALQDFVTYFRYFQKKTGVGFYFLIALFFFGSYLNGFGFTLLLPLLNIERFNQGEQFSWLSRIFSIFGTGPSLTNLLILFSITFALKGFFQFLQEWHRIRLTARLITNLQLEMASSYSRLNFAYYSKTKSGFFTNLFTNESSNLISGLHAYIMFLGSFMNSVVLFVFAVAINKEVTISALVAGGVIFTLSTRLRVEMAGLSRETAKINGSLVHYFIQFVVGFKYLKSIEGYFRYTDRIDEVLSANKALLFRKGFIKAVIGSIYEPLTVIFLCVVIYFEVMHGGKSLAEIAVPLLLLNRFLASFFAFQLSWHDFIGATGSIIEFEDGMKTLTLNQEDTRGKPVGALRKGIELNNLSFSYGDRKVLDKVNLFIPRNKCIAIVGESGAGKSTLLNILAGLLPASGGAICYDNEPYAELEKVQLRAKFGYVTQEAVLFDTTIENNITLWQDRRSETGKNLDLVNAAKSAHCLDFVLDSPEGFSRVIGDRGTAISGGQRQRLVIAREIYRNPEILIFDEATSSLDSESETFIQDTIRSFLGSKTMAIVAHRVSSLRFCDFIYVLKDGRVVEEGTWTDLLAQGKDTYFSKIYSAQKV